MMVECAAILACKPIVEKTLVERAKSLWLFGLPAARPGSFTIVARTNRISSSCFTANGVAADSVRTDKNWFVPDGP